VDRTGQAAGISRVLVRAELAQDGQDLVLTLERELHVLTLGHLDDLVVAMRRGLAVDDHFLGLRL